MNNIFLNEQIFLIKKNELLTNEIDCSEKLDEKKELEKTIIFLLNKRVFQKIKKVLMNQRFLEQTFEKTIVFLNEEFFKQMNVFLTERSFSDKKNKIDEN